MGTLPSVSEHRVALIARIRCKLSLFAGYLPCVPVGVAPWRRPSLSKVVTGVVERKRVSASR
jgi:hypothetical protein